MKISIVNDKDFVNETGTLTVYHSRDILKSDDYEYFLYDKVGRAVSQISKGYER